MIIQYLSIITIQILDTGPAELHFYFVVNKLKYFQPTDIHLSELVQDISYAVSKLRTNNFLSIGLLLIGIPMSQIESLLPSQSTLRLTDCPTFQQEHVSELLGCITNSLSTCSGSYIIFTITTSCICQ